jgi:hypothetical protein
MAMQYWATRATMYIYIYIYIYVRSPEGNPKVVEI